MFDACADALALYAFDVSRCDAGSQNGVFGIVFKVATAERCAMDVHAGSQKHVAAILQHFVADGFTHLLHQLCVPSRGQGDTYGETCAVECIVRSLTTRGYADSCRSVGQDGCGNAQSGDCVTGTCSTGHIIDSTPLTVEVVTAYEQMSLLFQRHCLYDFVYVVGTQFQVLCLCLTSKEKEDRDNG